MLEFPSNVPGQIPEQHFELIKDGVVRVRLIVQMWKLVPPGGGERLTYATTAVFGPVGMTDEDARWMAENIRRCFNMLERTP